MCCVQTSICALLSIIGRPDGHRGPFNQVMLRRTHLYSLPSPAIPPHTGRPSTTPTPLAILPHIAMQLVLIDILSFPPCPLPFTDIYDIRYQYID